MRPRWNTAVFARAVELGTDQARLYLEYGRVLEAGGHSREAVGVLKTAAQLNRQGNDAHFELAVALVQSGSYGDALREFELVKKLPAEQAVRYFYNLAYAHYRLGDSAGARKLLDKAAPFVKTDRDRTNIDELRAACCVN